MGTPSLLHQKKKLAMEGVDIEEWARRSYCAAMAVELWRDNACEGQVARSARAVCHSGGLWLPNELWIEICQVLVETFRVAKLHRLLTTDLDAAVKDVIRNKMEIEYAMTEGVEISMLYALQTQRERRKAELLRILEHIHLGCYVLHRERRRFIGELQALMRLGLVTMQEDWRDQLLWPVPSTLH